MNTSRLFNTAILVLLLLALLVMPVAVSAQDGPFTEATPLPDDSGVVVPSPGFSLAEFFAGLFAGAMGALIGVFGIIGRIKNDKAALDAIEWLGKSVPADVVVQLNDLGKALRDAGEVLDKVTDGKPNTTPPTPQRHIPIQGTSGATPSG